MQEVIEKVDKAMKIIDANVDFGWGDKSPLKRDVESIKTNKVDNKEHARVKERIERLE
jgi:hypothetical protein